MGISTHFPYRRVRYGLIGLGIALLVLSLVQLSALPLPPPELSEKSGVGG